MSSRIRKPKKRLSDTVLRILGSQKCQKHTKSAISLLNPQSGKLICSQCLQPSKNNSILSIRQALQNPILTILKKQLHKQNQFSFNSNFYFIIKNNLQSLNIIKKGFLQITNKMKEEFIEKLSAIQNYFCKIQQDIFGKSQQEIEYIQKVQTQYREHFEYIVQEKFVKGSVEELQEIFFLFMNKSENPSIQLENKFEKIYENLKFLPEVNWKKLENLYCRVNDPSIWKIQTFFNEKSEFLQQSMCLSANQRSKYNQEDKIRQLLPNIQNDLTNRKYSISYDLQGIKLSIQEKGVQDISSSIKNKFNHQDSLDIQDCHSANSHLQINTQYQVSQVLDEVITCEHDTYYQLDQFRVLGVGYNTLTVYNYAFGKLQQTGKFQIQGCTTVLNYSDCLIVLANSKIIRLWLQDGKQQILGMGYQEIHKVGDYFISIDMERNKKVRSAKHNLVKVDLQDIIL